MREMKDSGVKWIGEIPKEWCVLPNKHLMKKEKNICEKYNGEDILSLSMKGVIVRDLDAGGKMPTTFDGYQYLRKGNLLMCLFDIDVTPRCIGLIKNDGLSSPAYSQFSLSKKANAEYYYYYYLMLDNSKTLYHLAKNLRHSLTEEQLGVIPTIAPPLADQQKIAAHLDRKCTQIDALISNAQQQIEKLKAYKQSVITETVTKGLDPDVAMRDSGVDWIGEIPENWGTPQIKHIATISSGSTPNRNNTEYWNGSIKWLKTGELQNNEITDSEEHITQKALEETSVTLFPVNTVLMAMYGQGKTRGMTALLKTPSTTNQACAGMTVVSQNILVKYFWKCLMGAYNGIREIAQGSGQPNLNAGLISSFIIPLPPKEEQQEIADYLDHKCSQIDKLIALKQQKIEKLQQYKKSVIYEYVTGKKGVE